MRTQLLNVIPAVASESESDNNTAANDATYSLAPAATRPVLTLAAIPAVVPLQREEGRSACEADEDYWLGGYAGI